jgi:hypothetical protein
MPVVLPIYPILIAALVTALILIVEHYFPWPMLIGRELRPVECYIAGVLAIHLPLTTLLLLWSSWEALAALWILTAAGGLVVMASHALDHYLDIRVRARIAEREAQTLRPRNGQDDD